MAYTSFLETLVEDISLSLDDPNASVKYSDTQVLRYAGLAMRRVYQDLQRLSSKPIVATLDFTVPIGATIYQLPPSVGVVINVGKWCADTNRWSWVVKSPTRAGPFRPGVFLSGRRLTFDAAVTSEVLELRAEFKPSGDFSAHEAQRTFTADLLETDEFALVQPADEATKLQRGLIDDRENAYVGAILRVWCPSDSPAVVQERVVTSHAIDKDATGKTRLLTVDSVWDPTITQNDTTSYSYEIVPVSLEGVRQAVALGAAMTLAAMSGLVERQKALLGEYRLAIRTERLAEAHANPQNQKFRKDTFYGMRRR